MNQNNQNSQKNQQKEPTADGRVRDFFATWINKQVELDFHMRSREVLTGKLLYYTRYEFVIQVAEDKAAILILKHGVDWIERVPSSAAK